MGTLKKTIDSIAAALDKTTDLPFKKRLSDIILSAYSEASRRYFDKYKRVPDSLLQLIPCIDVKYYKNDPCCNTGNCTVKRTSIKIPSPIRLGGESKFQFVGTTSLKVPFSHIDPGEIDNFLNYDIYSKGDPRYSWIGGYIYIYNSGIDKIAVVAPYSNPFELSDIQDCAGNTCYVEKEIPDDMLYIIKQLVYQELGLTPQVPEKEDIPLQATK